MTYSEKNMAYLQKKKTYTLFLKKKTSVCLKVKSVSVIIGKNKLIALVKSRKTFTSIPLMV